MRKLTILILILLLAGASSQARQPADSVKQAKLKEKIKKDSIVAANRKAATKTAQAAPGSAKTDTTVAAPAAKETAQVSSMSDSKEWGLVLLPAILFIVVISSLYFSGLNKFDIQAALTENEMSKLTVPNPVYIATPAPANLKDIPPTIEISETTPSYRPSISRYIAFVSSILIIIIAVCMSCFFIYGYIRTGKAPELSQLSAVLMALGIGIVPYTANKLSAAISKRKPEDL